MHKSLLFPQALETLGTADEGCQPPGGCSPASEELPKWLREARCMRQQRQENLAGAGKTRSVGSNYLDSYLGNLTHHSWLSYAPSTPTQQQSLYQPNRVYLQPEAFFKKEAASSQQLFMSRSFTEGVSCSDSSFPPKLSLGSNQPSSMSTSSNVNNEVKLRDTDSPNTDYSTCTIGRGAQEEISVAPSFGTESGMGTDVYTHPFSPSLGLSNSESLPEISAAVVSEPEHSFAVDSLETDVPCFTETSGVITHESDTGGFSGVPLEVVDDEVTISENFPDIPFETENNSNKYQTVSENEVQLPERNKTDIPEKNLSTSVDQSTLSKSGIHFEIGGPVGYVDDNSASNASDESSCCTQPSTIVILQDSPAKQQNLGGTCDSLDANLDNIKQLTESDSNDDKEQSIGPSFGCTWNESKNSDVISNQTPVSPSLIQSKVPAILDNESALDATRMDIVTTDEFEDPLLKQNNQHVINNNLLNNFKNLESDPVIDNKDDIVEDSLNSSIDSIITNTNKRQSVDSNDNTTNIAAPVNNSELDYNSADQRGASGTDSNSGSGRSVSFDFSNVPMRSITSTPETSIMSTSSISEVMGSSFIAPDETVIDAGKTDVGKHLSKELSVGSDSNLSMTESVPNSMVVDSGIGMATRGTIEKASNTAVCQVKWETGDVETHVTDTKMNALQANGHEDMYKSLIDNVSTAPKQHKSNINYGHFSSSDPLADKIDQRDNASDHKNNKESNDVSGIIKLAEALPTYNCHSNTNSEIDQSVTRQSIEPGTSSHAPHAANEILKNAPSTAVANSPTEVIAELRATHSSSSCPSASASPSSCTNLVSAVSPITTNKVNGSGGFSPGHVGGSVVMPSSRVTTPMSSPHRHSSPTTPSNQALYSPVAGTPVLGKCSSRQHQMNALLQLLRVQHHHEREQLILKQQEEMQQFVQHLQKLSPSQLQHIVSTQVNSVQSNRGSNRANGNESESKSPGASEALPPSSPSQNTSAPESSSPCDDSYSGNNSITASQSTPSLSEGKNVANSSNVMPSFYLHNPTSITTATTPGHLSKLFLQFPVKKSPSPGIQNKASTPPQYSKPVHGNTVMPGHALPHSHSSADLNRAKKISRSHSDGVENSPKESPDAKVVCNVDTMYSGTHSSTTSVSVSQNPMTKSIKQTFLESHPNYRRPIVSIPITSNSPTCSHITNSSNVIKEKLLSNTTKGGAQLAPITPHEDMAELSASLTNSDIFNSLQSSMISDSGLNGPISRSVTITKLTTETFLPASLPRRREVTD